MAESTMDMTAKAKPKQPVKLSLVPTTKAPAPAATARIAFATANNELVDQHFGSAMQFAIYEISHSGAQLTALIEFPKGAKGHDVNKLQLRVDALTKCAAIYCNAIGSSAVRQLISLGIKPITVELGTDIKASIKTLTQQWQQQKNHWLDKYCQKMTRANQEGDGATADEDARLASLLAEDWEK